VVYLTIDNYGAIVALDAAEGTERWRFTTKELNLGALPAIAGGVLYVGSWDMNLYALDAMTGAELWRFATDAVIPKSCPAAFDRMVYVASDDGNVYALDSDTGTERWRFRTGVKSVAPCPAVLEGAVYVGSEDGIVHALEAVRPELEKGIIAAIAEGGTVLRGGPTETAVVRAELDEGTGVVIIGESEIGVDGVEWWPVTVNDTGEAGWIMGEHLVAVFPDE